MDERTHARYMSDIAYFLSKMEAEPNSGYFIPIALAYNKLEKYDETIAMCKSAIERFPANCAAKTFLAEAYVYKGQFDLARELLFDVTAEDDNNYKALKLLGIICKESGDTTDALKYLTGAYIRSPEDEEVRKMIEELGGSLNPAQIYDERMKRQSQAALDSEEDEELRTYQEIDQRIRNAEIIMADLVSDTTISARDYSEEEDFYSDDPNDFMPLITSHPEEEEEEEEFSDDPNDFLPTITQHEESEDESSDNQEEQYHENTLTIDDDELLSALGGDDNSAKGDELLTALSNDDNNAGDDDLLSALAGDEDNNKGDDDLLSALSGDDENKGEDDLLSALSSDDSNAGDDDLLSASARRGGEGEIRLCGEPRRNAPARPDEDNKEDDLLSALSSEESSESEDDLLAALSSDENNQEESLLDTLQEEADSIESGDLLSELSADNESGDSEVLSEINDDNVNEDIGLNSNQEAEAVENIEEQYEADSKDDETSNEEILSNEQNESDSEYEPDEINILDMLNEEPYGYNQDTSLEENAEETSISDEVASIDEALDSEVENEVTADDNILIDSDENQEIIDEEPIEEQIIEEPVEETGSEEDKLNEDETLQPKEEEITEEEKEARELYSRKIPSSVVDMTYDDMIDDDFQYGKIVDESYKEADMPSVDLGESAPFTQGDIMDEILDAVGMTHEDMTNDEQIELSEKERKLERLEQFLEKVRNNKENI